MEDQQRKEEKLTARPERPKRRVAKKLRDRSEPRPAARVSKR